MLPYWHAKFFAGIARFFNIVLRIGTDREKLGARPSVFCSLLPASFIRAICTIRGSFPILRSPLASADSKAKKSPAKKRSTARPF
ncbi:MAG: hypothetical protein DME26_13005 [Verrucomicrobia bacterium]|nr:MAG: hypothetical protein DME26_13005 [Verrucomicrobiota bacterium]